MQITLPWRTGQAKPFGSIPRINWDHPLARNLLFYGYDTGSGLIIDLAGINNTTMQTVGTVDPNKTSKYGSGISYAGSGTRYFNATSAIRSPGTHTSWACGYMQTGTVVSNSRPFCRTDNNGSSGGGGSPDTNWDFRLNPGGGGQFGIEVCYLASNGGQYFSGNRAFNSQNTFMSVLISLAGTGANTLNLYGQGSVQLTESPNFGLGNNNTNDAICFCGASSASAINTFIGFVYYGAFWNRALTAEEARLLHNDPYCFLIYPEDEMFATLVGTGVIPPVADVSPQFFVELEF